MSVEILTMVECDNWLCRPGCLNLERGNDNSHLTAAKQRAILQRDYGWHQSGRFDYCANCWEAKIRESKRRAFEKEL